MNFILCLRQNLLRKIFTRIKNWKKSILLKNMLLQFKICNRNWWMAKHSKTWTFLQLYRDGKWISLYLYLTKSRNCFGYYFHKRDIWKSFLLRNRLNTINQALLSWSFGVPFLSCVLQSCRRTHMKVIRQ
jgi:hypothetical protein